MKIEGYTFSKSEIELLEKYRDEQSDARLQRRFLTLLMLARDLSIEMVQKLYGISHKTIQRWFDMYYQRGIDSLHSFQYQAKPSSLTSNQEGQLFTCVKKNSPGNREMIQAYILKTFGVHYAVSSISGLMKRLGLKKLRPKTVPGKSPSLEDQVQWMLRYFSTREFARLDPGIVQLFGDGMHLHHQLVPSLCWGDPKDPPILPTNSNRKRINILGAFSLLTYQLTHLTSEDNCDAQKVIAFLKKLLKAYPEAHSIVLYLDNASYFHAAEVQKWIEKHPQIIIEALPTYSPNLNLIDRLWRFVKGKLVANRYYEKYKTLRAQAFRVLNHIHEFKNELKTLMTEKFELITANPMPGQT